jgi:translation initiation factor IF-2
MSEERVIRINKVLRELNISLERAVDYLKDKGIAIESNPNAKISENEFGILQNQFAGDKGNKQASQEVGEEKRKEKEALRIEREKEIEDKRKADEERQQQEVIKAKATTVTGPKQVGTIDLNPQKPATTPAAKKEEKPVVKSEKPSVKTEKPKPASIKDEVKEKPETVAKPSDVAPVDEVFNTQYTKLSRRKKKNLK